MDTTTKRVSNEQMTICEYRTLIWDSLFDVLESVQTVIGRLEEGPKEGLDASSGRRQKTSSGRTGELK